MPITTERYIPDRGRVTINTVDQSGSIRTLSPSAPRRTTREINTLGGNVTESQDRDKAGDYEISMEVLDDRSKNNPTSGVMYVLWTAYSTNTPLTELKVIPAGSSIGMTEYSYSNVEVVQCPPHGNMDSDTDEEAIANVVITASGVSSAALT